MAKKNIKEDEPVKNTDSSSKLITKIKFNLKTKVPEISYRSENVKCSKEIKVKGKKKALDEFLSAMQALKPFFCNVCEIEHKINEAKISGISFGDKGFVITGQIQLTKNDIKAPLVVNTTHIAYENSKGFSAPEDIIKMLDELKTKAENYTNGDTKDKQMPIIFSAQKKGKQ